MKAADLKERSTEDLVELKATLTKELFSQRMKNATGQLEDTSLLGKTRKDIARVELLLGQRAAAELESSKQSGATAQGETKS